MYYQVKNIETVVERNFEFKNPSNCIGRSSRKITEAQLLLGWETVQEFTKGCC